MSENINEDELNSLAMDALNMGGRKDNSSADNNHTANQNKSENIPNTQKANDTIVNKSGDKPNDEVNLDNAFEDLTKKRGLEREEFAKKQEEDLARKRRDEALDKIIAERGNPKPQDDDSNVDDDKPLRSSDITKIVQDTVKNTLNEYEKSKNVSNDEDKLISDDLNKFTESNVKAKQFEPQIKKLMQSHPTISAEFAYLSIMGKMAELQASGKKLSIGTTKDNLNNNLDVNKMSESQLRDQIEREFGEGGNGMLFTK